MIEVRGVSKQFDSTWLFRNIDFSVTRGTTSVILGPSGSGKSVLLKIIAGLESATEGTASVASSRLGMLFQRNALFDSLSVYENLRFPLGELSPELADDLADARIKKWLSAVGLPGTERLFPEELSGGMQKRLGIARALIVEPEVVLYDEPTAGLDPVTSRMIAELMKDLGQERGLTSLIVTNDIQRAYQLGDQICLLAKGALKVAGTPEQVRQSRDPAIRQFVQGLRDGPLTTEAGAP